MEEHDQDRRKNDALFLDRIEKIHDKFDAFQELLTKHMKEEEEIIRDIHKRIDDFFYDLEPKTHVKHHTYVQNLKDSDEDLNKIKKEQIAKWIDRIIFAVATFILMSVYYNIKYEVNTPTPPRIEQKHESKIP